MHPFGKHAHAKASHRRVKQILAENRAPHKAHSSSAALHLKKAKPHAAEMVAEGGKRGKRYAKGGKVKSMRPPVVNIVHAHFHKPPMMGPPGMAPGQGAPGASPMMAPPAGAMAMQGPPPAPGMAGPPGQPPVMRARGGRLQMTAGSMSGIGRLEQVHDMEGRHR
jgi:hypothetical protein